MSGQSRENWKRLMGKLPSTNTSVDSGDILRVQDQGRITTNATGLGGFPLSGTPVVGSVYVFDGTNMVVSGVTTPSTLSSFTATVGSGVTADYNSVGAAVTAGKTDVLVIANTLESGSMTLPANFNMRIANNAVVNLQNANITLTDPGLVSISGPGTLRAQYSSAKAMFSSAAPTSSKLILSNIVLQPVTNAYIADCAQFFEDVTLLLPNSNAITILRPANTENAYTRVTFSGGGSSCADYVRSSVSQTSERDYFKDLRFIGTFTSAGQVTNGSWNFGYRVFDGVINDSATSFALNPGISAVSKARSAGGVLTINAAAANAVALSDSSCAVDASPLMRIVNSDISTFGSTNGFNASPIHIDNCHISTWNLPANFHIGASRISNSRFTTMNVSHGIISNGGASIVGCNFVNINPLKIGGSGMMIHGCFFDDLVMTSDSSGCTVVGCRVDSITDNGVANVSGLNTEY